jgi:hypothetical protein
MKSEGKQPARERLAVGAQGLVNAAPAFRREEAACAIASLADTEQRGVAGNRLERVTFRPLGILSALAEPALRSGPAVSLGLPGSDRHRRPPAAPAAPRTAEALVL